MGYKYNVYVAGPFFNKNQIDIIERIKAILEKTSYTYYSPKDECLYTPDNEVTSDEVFKGNIEAINKCDFLIAVTDGRDVGTMFEAGYAYRSGIPIIYLWVNHQNRPFNIMLAESGVYIAYGFVMLHKAMEYYRGYGEFPQKTVRGELE